MIEKVTIGFYPTPLHRLNNLSKTFANYQLFIKRDDMTGLASGGNKVRKLEYLLADARQSGKEIVVTVGSQQSNHCRQTAAACRMFGLECHLLLNGSKPKEMNGNLLLSHLLGATIHFTEHKSREQATKDLLSELDATKTYFIPVGGSNLMGSYGYVDAVNELQQQLETINQEIDYIFVASGSGGTHAGLLVGKKVHQLSSEIIGVRIDKHIGHQTIEEHTVSLINDGFQQFNIQKEFTIEELNMLTDYDEAGYSVITNQEVTMIKKLANADGIMLDPVYTARAFYGMYDQLKQRQLPAGSNILFWHTGGLPSLFHYNQFFQ